MQHGERIRKGEFVKIEIYYSRVSETILYPAVRVITFQEEIVFQQR